MAPRACTVTRSPVTRVTVRDWLAPAMPAPPRAGAVGPAWLGLADVNKDAMSTVARAAARRLRGCRKGFLPETMARIRDGHGWRGGVALFPQIDRIRPLFREAPVGP